MDQFHELIVDRIFEKRHAVRDWFALKFKENSAPFYSSYDVRDSSFKIAPVDCNLYPAGFNNICSEDLSVAHELLQDWVKVLGDGKPPKKIAILPESHTSNKFYIENLWTLQDIFVRAGFETRIAWWTGDEGNPPHSVSLESVTGKVLEAFPIKREGNRILLSDGFEPEWIILNNDFSSGYPKILDGVQARIYPSHKLGWHSRRKSTHFRYYNKYALEFANLLSIDPWLVSIDSQVVEGIDLNEGVGADRAADAVGAMIDRLQTEYSKRKIPHSPTVFLKNDHGTYGIGIHVVHSADEVRNLNRRAKNKLSVGKGKSEVHEILIQEGIPTQLVVENLISEPVIYLFGSELIGGFIRSNTERGDNDNLNSQGMLFKKLCMRDLREAWDAKSKQDFPIHEAIYGSISLLSCLAAAEEMKELKTI